jgi:hypothetical protein
VRLRQILRSAAAGGVGQLRLATRNTRQLPGQLRADFSRDEGT